MPIEGIKPDTSVKDIGDKISEISKSGDYNRLGELQSLQETLKNNEKPSHESIREGLAFCTEKEKVDFLSKLVTDSIGEANINMISKDRLVDREKLPKSEGSNVVCKYIMEDPSTKSTFGRIIDKFNIYKQTSVDKRGKKWNYTGEANIYVTLGNSKDPTENTVIIITGKYDKDGVFSFNDDKNERLWNFSTEEKVNKELVARTNNNNNNNNNNTKLFQANETVKENKKRNEGNIFNRTWEKILRNVQENRKIKTPDELRSEAVREGILAISEDVPILQAEILDAQKKIIERTVSESIKIVEENNTWVNKISDISLSILIDRIKILSKQNPEEAKKLYYKIHGLYKNSHTFVDKFMHTVPKDVLDVVRV